MNSSSPEIEKKHEELDLLGIIINTWQVILKFIVGIGKLLLELVLFMLRKWLPLLVSIIVGVGLSYIAKNVLKPYFVSDITFRSNVIPNSEMIPYINKLHKFCLDNNVRELSESFRGVEIDVSTIKDINAFWVIDLNRDGIPDYNDYKNKHNIYDTVNVRMPDRFGIRISVRDAEDFGTVRDGIINYISKNSSFQDRNRLRIAQVDEDIIRYNYDIVQLDSLQNVKYFEETRSRIPQTGGQMIFLQEQKTQLLYPDILDLTRRRQEADRERNIYSDIITIILDFTPTSSVFNSSRYYIYRIVPVLFSFTLLLLIMIAVRKRVVEMVKNR